MGILFYYLKAQECHHSRGRTDSVLCSSVGSEHLRVDRRKSDLASTETFRGAAWLSLGTLYVHVIATLGSAEVEQRGREVEILGAYSPELVEKHLVELQIAYFVSIFWKFLKPPI